jgi:antitoxin HigA-1
VTGSGEDDLKVPPTTTKIKTSAVGRRRLPPVHPGEVLFEEFLKPFGISQYRVAKDIRVHPRRINEIVHGKRAISADTALRLSRYFGTSERFWMNLQADHDLEREKDRVGKKILKEVPRYATLP